MVKTPARIAPEDCPMNLKVFCPVTFSTTGMAASISATPVMMLELTPVLREDLP